ncbi:Laccase-4 [Striga hermonthica]|uniref:laccase n=1 Tax=Striga hermonthica TaxID=68872 RepID=A0A9N7NPG7_STRHE|nr:Laccase-4 [Striga hermonthica]
MGLWQFRILILVSICLSPVLVQCKVRHYQFNVATKSTTRLCSSKPIVTVNGKFPGPTIYAREGDTLLVRVINRVKYNVSIHWHGVRQLRTGWADGPAYITQCPIQPGHSYVYNFTITGQRGTLFWHAHILWLRSTVHGALVILPKLGVSYPFPKPDHERVVVLSEWWKSDTEAVINEAIKSGLAPNVSDAHTINGHPGLVSNCSSADAFSLSVAPGKTYLLRLINAALNEELFFKIAGHQLTVVEVDATYVKPFKTDTVLVAPGQTTNVILAADRASGKYMVTASPFLDTMSVAVDNATAVAAVHYIGTLAAAATTATAPPPRNATSVANAFLDSLRVWFMHCHLEVHTTWGLKMAFLVDNGKGPNQSILPPPKDLPKC